MSNAAQDRWLQLATRAAQFGTTVETANHLAAAAQARDAEQARQHSRRATLALQQSWLDHLNGVHIDQMLDTQYRRYAQHLAAVEAERVTALSQADSVCASTRATLTQAFSRSQALEQLLADKRHADAAEALRRSERSDNDGWAARTQPAFTTPRP